MFPNINWSRFLDYSYWFEGATQGPGSLNVTPVIERDTFFFWFFIVSFSLFIVVAVLLFILQVFLHNNHPLKDKLPFVASNLAWMGVLGFGWFAMRQISVTFLGARYWLLIGLVWIIFLVFLIGRYFWKYFPLEWAYFKKNHLPN